MRFRGYGERSQRAWLALIFVVVQLASCALPDIQREKLDVGGTDAGTDAATMQVSPLATDDVDAGEGYDPEFDPANRNEDLAAFRSLVPPEHQFAEWPMPDTTPGSTVKPSYSVTEKVVTDNVTKLRWQRHLPDTYPGCTGKYNFVGRDRAPASGCTWEEALAYCRRPEVAEELGGGEWRLPTKNEAESLVDQMRVNAIDPVLDSFPIDFVWTASPFLNPGGLKLAWAVDYMEGHAYDSARYKAGRVRCVSSPNKTGGSRPNYEIVDQKIVHDRSTGLTWQQVPDSETRDWADARAYCEALELEGVGWRLPNVKELLTLVDSSRRAPAIDHRTFLVTASDRFWAANEYINGRGQVFTVSFDSGAAFPYGTPAERHYVHCVRSSEPR